VSLPMSTVYISELAHQPVFEYLKSCGHNVVTVRHDPRLGEFTGAHPDLRICSLGPGRGVMFADEADFRPDYPENAAWCAVFLEKYIICNPDLTSPALLKAAEALGLALIPVRQGYAKCSCAVVDGSSVITADPGISAALEGVGDISLLRVSPGGVLLPGYDVGFFGGATGLVGKELIINGDLSTHPDCDAIFKFCESRGVTPRHFPGYPLTDIGTIVEKP